MPSGYKYNCVPASALILTTMQSGSYDYAKEKLHLNLP